MRRATRKIDDTDLRDLLINPKLNRRGQYICDCPFCGKEKHFYISRQTQLWDCKKCGEYGSIYKLLKQLDKTYLLGGATVEIRETIQSLRNIVAESVEDDEVMLKELPVIKMPVGWKVSLASTKYLLERGITPDDCKRYNIGATDLYRKYQNYVLIPIYDGGKIRGFVGRYGAKKVPSDRLRYNNSVGTEFSELLFGYDEITENTTTVILVEGIFDKIAVDKVLHLWDSEEIKCVCTFGKKISPEQSKKLMSKGVTNVILLYDFDAIKDIKKYGLELENNFVTSITYTSSKKDIDECSPEEALKVFEHLQKPREFNEDVIGKLKKWNKEVKTREEQIKAITVEDTTQLKKDRKKLKEEIDELDEEVTETKTIRRKIQAELNETITCPKCKHEFINESELELSVEEAKGALKESDMAITAAEKKLDIKNKKMKKLKNQIAEAERAEELVGEIEEEKSGYERKIKNKTQDRADLVEKIAKWENDKKAIKKRKKDDKLLNSLNQRIGECDTEIEKLTKQLLPISEEMETIKFWQFNMGKSGFSTYLANKSIKIIEGITNSYLRKFGVDISVLINGFTVLKSGDVREKIDVFVLNDGVTAEQFLAKSGGERGRVALAGVLGIQHLINLSTNGRGLNLLCFDECFHGMDSKGQENIIKIFEKMGITILVITQNVSESFNNENTLYVVKDKDVSRYV